MKIKTCNMLSYLWKPLLLVKRLYRLQRRQIIALFLLLSFLLLSVCRYLIKNDLYNWDYHETLRSVQRSLAEKILQEKGTGCEMPYLDPFSEEAMKHEKFVPKVECGRKDWVQCHKNECSVEESILNTTNNVVCTYRDIIYITDSKYTIGKAFQVVGKDKYVLKKSDHVKVSCSGTEFNSDNPKTTLWNGFKAGLRYIPAVPIDDSINVMILAFDSASRNGIIRRMPRTLNYLQELGAVILNSYNILGDGTVSALYPLFTGKMELEHPDTRKGWSEAVIDPAPFIFQVLKKVGYRTAYFEESPSYGTFNYRHNGFSLQPADHFLRALLLEEAKGTWWFTSGHVDYCFGDIPQFQFFLNLTSEFLQLHGKKFAFTFISDISHDDFSYISLADENVAEFLQAMKERGDLRNTLTVVMGDHGIRYGSYRNTHQGKLEERLPFMAIYLPEKLTLSKPDALAALQHNADVLTTHFDMHTTLLDAVGLWEKRNEYMVPGSDLPRGMSLLKKIPKSRSCSEAGVLSYWCACTKWYNLSESNPLYHKTAIALANFIDNFVEDKRSLCVRRSLLAIKWVLSQSAKAGVIEKGSYKNWHRYFGEMYTTSKPTNEYYQVKIEMSPGPAIYEGLVKYNGNEDRFVISDRDISRVNAYGDQANCIRYTHPHLIKFCYCKDKLQ